ncbi:hypothetical protein PoB_000981300 [Plakobranchus ocellatus]|uniref:Uncharacterized protein n=1 Tax=Plakobranchus ocellatus TaxID=259542 RepID=A0AAV3YLT0_9GAST|nr:hypothetical protein PoB_000981300 [Plakobranchus ocellatus]
MRLIHSLRIDIVALVEPDKPLSMSGLNPGTVGAIVSLTIDQWQAKRLGIDFLTRKVKRLPLDLKIKRDAGYWSKVNEANLRGPPLCSSRVLHTAAVLYI